MYKKQKFSTVVDIVMYILKKSVSEKFFGSFLQKRTSAQMHSSDSQRPVDMRICVDGTDSMRSGERAG